MFGDLDKIQLPFLQKPSIFYWRSILIDVPISSSCRTKEEICTRPVGVKGLLLRIEKIGTNYPSTSFSDFHFVLSHRFSLKLDGLFFPALIYIHTYISNPNQQTYQC